MVAIILDHCLGTAIKFYGVLHIFWDNHWTGEASINAKLIQRLVVMRKDALYKIFLDLQKVYNATDKDIFLEILEGIRLQKAVPIFGLTVLRPPVHGGAGDLLIWCYTQIIIEGNTGQPYLV